MWWEQSSTQHNYGIFSKSKNPLSIVVLILREPSDVFSLLLPQILVWIYNSDFSSSYHLSFRSSALGFFTGVGRVAAIMANVVFGRLVDTNCAVPVLLVSALLLTGGLVALLLPQSRQTELTWWLRPWVRFLAETFLTRIVLLCQCRLCLLPEDLWTACLRSPSAPFDGSIFKMHVLCEEKLFVSLLYATVISTENQTTFTRQCSVLFLLSVFK